MIETDLLTFALNNGVGVLFGILLYTMAEKQRKENAKAIEHLNIAIQALTNVLDKRL